MYILQCENSQTIDKKKQSVQKIRVLRLCKRRATQKELHILDDLKKLTSR